MPTRVPRSEGDKHLNGLLLRVGLLSVIAGLLLSCGMSHSPQFRGSLLFLAGTMSTDQGLKLVELNAIPDRATYSSSIIASNVSEAVLAPDGIHLLYTARDGVFIRDLQTGSTTKVGANGDCPEWAPDSKHFSLREYLPRSDKQVGSRGRLQVFDLNGTAKSIWEDSAEPYGFASQHSETAVGMSGCAKWIAPDRLVFERFTGPFPAQKMAGEYIKPNTTSIAILGEPLRFIDARKEYLVAGVCPFGSTSVLQKADDSSLFVSPGFNDFPVLGPLRVSCTQCSFVGFDRSCSPYFFERVSDSKEHIFRVDNASLLKMPNLDLNIEQLSTGSLPEAVISASGTKIAIAPTFRGELNFVDLATGRSAVILDSEIEPAGQNHGFLDSNTRLVAWVDQ